MGKLNALVGPFRIYGLNEFGAFTSRGSLTAAEKGWSLIPGHFSAHRVLQACEPTLRGVSLLPDPSAYGASDRTKPNGAVAKSSGTWS